MAIAIRDARADDLGEVSRVMVAAYEEYMPTAEVPVSQTYRDVFDAYRRDIADVYSRVDTADLVVAEERGKILAAVTFYRPNVAAEYPGGDDHETWPTEWAAFRLLAVDPAQRGRGLGKALTAECIARARELGAPAIGLHTTRLMTVAREMYERMGWVRAPRYDFNPMPDFVVEAYALDLSAPADGGRRRTRTGRPLT